MFDRTKIKVDKNQYETLCLQREAYNKERLEYREKYWKSQRENAFLETERAILMKFFDSHADTDAIKYNGKLYRIASTAHFKDDDRESLDITAVPVGEVN